MRFWNVHPSNRHRFKGAGFELFSECSQFFVWWFIERRHGFLVDTGSVPSCVGADVSPCCSQPLTITEQVVEVHEWIFGFPFCLSTKFLLHFIDIHWGDSCSSALGRLPLLRESLKARGL